MATVLPLLFKPIVCSLVSLNARLIKILEEKYPSESPVAYPSYPLIEQW